MADEQTTTEGGTPEAETTETTQTPEQLQAALAEAQKRIKELNKESAERRKKLEALEQAENAKKAAEMTDLQKAQAELESLKPQLDALKAEKQALLVQATFEKTARTLKLEFASEKAQETAYKLLDMDAVGEDGAGMKDALTALQKEHPYLFGKVTPPQTDGQQKGKTSGEPNLEAILEAKRRQYGTKL